MEKTKVDVMCNECPGKSSCPEGQHGSNIICSFDNQQIKRCPFCGGTPKFVIEKNNDSEFNGEFVSVECSKCGARTKSDTVLSYAIKAWNKRNV